MPDRSVVHSTFAIERWFDALDVELTRKKAA